MRRGAALLVALLVAGQAEGALPVEDQYEKALPVEDEYEKALQDEAWRTECRGCPRCPLPPAHCTFLVSSGLTYFYNVDGVKLKIELEVWRVKLTCPAGSRVTLESASLPVFPTHKHVLSVELTACPVPRAAGGISRALSRLNITGGVKILRLYDVPSTPRLQPDLFAGLQYLRMLYLSAKRGLVLEPPPGLLEPLTKLQSLHLVDVRTSPATLAQLPSNLTKLYLEQIRPAAPSTDLENVTLTAARGSCSSLLRLSVSSPREVAALPAGWLQVRGEARCPRLRELELYFCALGGLPADALRGLTQLRQLNVTYCYELRALPRGLFVDTRDLRQLVLANNALEVLPDGIFAPLHELEQLDLSGNRLGVLGDGAAALDGVRSLRSLQVLKLDRNPLGDTCGHMSRNATLYIEQSPLHELSALRRLSLAHTGASRLCVDWRRDLVALNMIDFSHNNLTELKFSDMQWYDRKCEVDLRGSPLRELIVTSEDYQNAPANLPLKVHAVLKFEADLARSSCLYWTARAMREGRIRARLVGLTWAGLPLAVAPLAVTSLGMMCTNIRDCPGSCSCTLYPSADTLMLHCAPRLGLPDLGPVARLAQRFELGLAGAHLASLPDALPASVRVLDLRNASLGAATERQAAALFADGREVLLEDARVACACAGGARPALALVLGARAAGVRCAEDGRRVREAAAAPCARETDAGLRGAVAGALGGLAVATLVLAGVWCAARRVSRLRLKAFLLARGLCAAWTHCDDDDCRYDVFIWFSRHDFEVVSQIVRELEAGPRPLRVCVHYRDWRAGESILAQIQRSVVQSRRTLVLVSEHVARSVWVRAVLREAAAHALRDVTPRLVVALLQPASPLGLDPELAHYVRANTYARWGDKCFWDRLRLALPPGRKCATAAVPPLVASAAPPCTTAVVPPSSTAAAPPRAASAAPPCTTAVVPPSTTAAAPPRMAPAAPPCTTAVVPPSSTAAAPPRAASAVPPPQPPP